NIENINNILNEDGSLNNFISYLKNYCGNDLTEYAANQCQEIGNILSFLEDIEECQLARMSGSGSTCFGLFSGLQNAKNSLERINRQFPNYWAKITRIGV
ncbi:MAG: hypothetical protein AAF195_03725, partial [Pseudomonadota bacterium]